MTAKLKLEVDALRVESFETDRGDAEPRGTVRGREEPCTCGASCACPSAPYYCAPIAYTYYSCQYTRNESCTVEPTDFTCASCDYGSCESVDVIC